jgi:Ca-activated chloride channel family protein
VNRWRRFGAVGTLVATGLVSACSSDEPVAVVSVGTTTTTDAATTTSSTVAATTTSSTHPAPTSIVTTSTVAATTTIASTGEANLDGPAEVGAGEKFAVNWTGPSALGDYITIVAAGATKWTNEPWFTARRGASPGSLVAPITDGAYALWYVSGATGTILARRAIRVTPFAGALGGPVEVQAGSNFEVAWNGPNGPGDYVTIVAADATKWTDESYFYTSNGMPGTLVAPLDAGTYVLWYVTGSDDATMATRPITVIPYQVTLDASDQVERGATFEVAWTGPNGPQDYITIVPAGSPPGTYASYAYTQNGSPVTLTAPDTAGNYEIWYASDRVKNIVFATIGIVVT